MCWYFFKDENSIWKLVVQNELNVAVNYDCQPESCLLGNDVGSIFKLDTGYVN